MYNAFMGILILKTINRNIIIAYIILSVFLQFYNLIHFDECPTDLKMIKY